MGPYPAKPPPEREFNLYRTTVNHFAGIGIGHLIKNPRHCWQGFDLVQYKAYLNCCSM